MPGQGIVKALILLGQSAVKIKERKVTPPSVPLVSLAAAMCAHALKTRIRANFV